MKIFDTHIHLNIDPLLSQASTLLTGYESAGIATNIIGTTSLDSQIAVDLSKQFFDCYCTIGIHPIEYDFHNPQALVDIEQLYLKNYDKVVAIGECGLDYHYPNTNKASQTEYFKKQIELAIKYDLTLVVHIRDAHEDALQIFNQYPTLKNVIIHCYSDNQHFALEYIKKDFYISFSGIITFKNAHELRQIIRELPLDRILTETDAPWLSPEPHRGQTNESSNMQYINECVAEIKNLSLEQINEILLRNAFNALKLNKLKKE